MNKLFAAAVLPLAALLFTGCASPLMKAAAAGDNDQVSSLVDKANQKQKDHALWSAINAGRLETTKLLLSKGASANAEVMVICPAEKQGAVMSLLARSQDMPVQAPVLVTAAHGGYVKIMEALLDAGANINAGVKKVMQWPCNHYTALIYGVRMNNPEVVRLLLDRGADVNARGGRLGGRTALEWAERWGGSDEIVAMLKAPAGAKGAAERQARAEAAKRENEAKLKAALDAVGGPSTAPAAAPATATTEPGAAAPAPKPKPKPAVATKEMDSQL